VSETSRYTATRPHRPSLIICIIATGTIFADELYQTTCVECTGDHTDLSVT